MSSKTAVGIVMCIYTYVLFSACVCMYECVYIYMCVCIETNVDIKWHLTSSDVHIHPVSFCAVYICTYIHRYIDADICTHVRIYVYTCVRMYVYTCVCVCVYIHVSPDEQQDGRGRGGTMPSRDQPLATSALPPVCVYIYTCTYVHMWIGVWSGYD